jgi:DNA-directed RNA polymerase specialized sigma24 family protein
VTAELDSLVPLIAAGDAEAFGRWLAGAERRLRDSLRSFAAVVDTEAVMQEALLRTWQVAPRFAPDGRADGLLRLAIRIARNLAVSDLRRWDRRGLVDVKEIEGIAGDLPPDPSPGDDPALRAAIEECRRQLPRQPARALAARLEGGGTERDERLAERLGMRLNTFLQNITRARRFLTECLRRRGLDMAGELA